MVVAAPVVEEMGFEFMVFRKLTIDSGPCRSNPKSKAEVIITEFVVRIHLDGASELFSAAGQSHSKRQLNIPRAECVSPRLGIQIQRLRIASFAWRLGLLGRDPSKGAKV